MPLWFNGSGLAAAPSAPASAPTKEEILQLDPFEVTGSFIKRAEVEGPAPVRTITREEIEVTGLASFSEIMGLMPEAGYTALNESTVDPVVGVSSLSMRMAGSANTLILIDGRRAVLTGASAGGAAFVDQNRFPAAMVERVEVLQDCGAIYGSGAAAGVVNIILRKNFTGTEVAARYGNSFRTDVAEKSFSTLVGVSQRKSSLTVGLNYSSRGALRASDTSFAYNADLTDRWVARGPYYATLIASGQLSVDLRQNIGPQARIMMISGQRNGFGGVNISGLQQGQILSLLPGTGGVPLGRLSQATPGFAVPWAAGTGGQFSATAAATFVAPILAAHSNPSNLYNTQEAAWLMPSYQRIGANFSFRRTLSPHASVYLRTSYQQNRSHSEAAPVPISYLVDNAISVPRTNYWNPFGVNVGFYYRPVDFGPLKKDSINESTTSLLGVQGLIAGRYSWDTGYTYGFDKYTYKTGNLISESRLRASLAKTTPDAFNVFGGAGFKNDADTLDSFRVATTRRSAAALQMWDCRISGEVLALPWGLVHAGLAAELRCETYFEVNDPLATTLNDLLAYARAADPTSGRRTTTGIVGEVHVPFVKRGEHRWLYNADLSAAARCDWFSEGTTSGVKPYFGLRLQPVRRLTLRASLAQTFRAPMLPMLYGGLQETFINLADARRPSNLTNDVFDSANQQRSVRGGGNPRLQPIDSRAYQFGLVYDLPGELFKGLTIGATCYTLKEENFPTQLSAYTICNNEVGGGTTDFVVREPGTETHTNRTTAPINILSGPNGAMTAIAPGQTVTVPGRIRYINNSYIPCFHTQIRGWDFSAAYSRSLGRLGRIRWQGTAAYYDYFLQGMMAQQMPNVAGIMDYYPRARLFNSLMWMRAPWNVGITHSYQRRSGEPQDFTEVEAYSVIGANVGRTFRGEMKKWLAGTRFTVGVDNAFDRDPPLWNRLPGYLPGFVRRPAGRFFYAEVRKTY